MTEKEARTKWCFKAIRDAENSNNPSFNRYHDGKFDKAMTCVGSGCMAWRWNEDKYECFSCNAIYESATLAERCCNGSAWNTIRTGRCGLAGRD